MKVAIIIVMCALAVFFAVTNAQSEWRYVGPINSILHGNGTLLQRKFVHKNDPNQESILYDFLIGYTPSRFLNPSYYGALRMESGTIHHLGAFGNITEAKIVAVAEVVPARRG